MTAAITNEKTQGLFQSDVQSREGELNAFLHFRLPFYFPTCSAHGKMSPLDQSTPPTHTHTACEDNVTAKHGEDQEEPLKEQGTSGLENT